MVVGLHPLVVEPVCWVTGRKDLLAATFVLGAMVVAVGKGTDEAFPSASRWTMVTVLAMLGIGAKPSAVVAPALVWLVARAARPRWPAERLTLALAPLGALAATITVFGARSVVDVHPRTASEALLDVLGAWTMQLGHVVWPVELVTSYGRYDGDPSTVAMGLAACALAALVVAASRLDRRSAAFVGLAFAAVAYAPVSGVLAVNRWSADSYMYLPLVGVAIAGVAAAGAWIHPRLGRLVTVLGPLLALTLMVDSFALASNWRTPDAPWRAAIERYPGNPVPYSELARTLAWEGRHDDSVRAYLALDQRFPDFEFARDERADALVEAGREGRAKALLAAGIAAGDRASAERYWLMLMRGQLTAVPGDRDDMRASFEMVWSGMRAQIRDPGAWSRVASLLRAVGLDEQAARCDAVLASRP